MLKVHDSKIRKILKKYGLFVRGAKRKPFILQKIWQDGLGLESFIRANHKTSGTTSLAQQQIYNGEENNQGVAKIHPALNQKWHA